MRSAAQGVSPHEQLNQATGRASRLSARPGAGVAQACSQRGLQDAHWPSAAPPLAAMADAAHCESTVGSAGGDGAHSAATVHVAHLVGARGWGLAVHANLSSSHHEPPAHVISPYRSAAPSCIPCHPASHAHAHTITFTPSNSVSGRDGSAAWGSPRAGPVSPPPWQGLCSPTPAQEGGQVCISLQNCSVPREAWARAALA